MMKILATLSSYGYMSCFYALKLVAYISYKAFGTPGDYYGYFLSSTQRVGILTEVFPR